MTAAQAGSRPGPAQTTDQIRAALHAAWEHARPAITARVHQLHRMILAMADTPLDTTLRAQAEREAHKLAGSAGTFGLHHASDLARELELILAGQPADPATTHRAGQLVASLRSEIDRPRATAEPVPAPATAPPGPLVLVVHADPRRAADWTAALRARGLTPVPAGDPRSGHAAAAHTHPTAAVIDVDGAGVTHDVAQLLEHLTRAVPPATVLVTGTHLGTADRLAAARAGALGFLDAGLPPPQIADAVAAHLDHPHQDKPTILIVDDDQAVLQAAAAVLRPPGYDVVTLEEPRRFWEALVEHTPDLLVLDIDLPHIGGFELCRLVRGDSRWRDLPVLILSASIDPDTVAQVFAAGADDFVAKPFVGAELVGRIGNRLDRIRLHRRLAETDPLTGLANRRKLEDHLSRLLRLAARRPDPLTVAILDVDHFKHVNDQHGHATGDLVLQQLAGWLARSFRGEELVARLGGEEFAVVGLGMTLDTAVTRLTDILTTFRQTGVSIAPDTTITVGVSAGIAAHPEHGTDFATLYRAADHALSRAKTTGRGRVLPARPPHPN